MRRVLLPVSALFTVGCVVGAFYLLLSTQPVPAPAPSSAGGQPWSAALDALLAAHGGSWPAAARLLTALAAALALCTAALRLERAKWRRDLPGLAAWAGLGIMLSAWGIGMPERAPTVTWTLAGLGGGLALGVVLRFVLGRTGAAQALRDVLLCGVFGLGVAWALHPALA